MSGVRTHFCAEVARRKGLVQEAETKLNEAVQQRSLPPNARTVKTTPSAIASRQRNVARVQKMVDTAEKELSKLEAGQSKLVRKLDDISAGRRLDVERLRAMDEAKTLPAQDDAFDGVRSTRLYENQVQVELSGKNAAWRGGNKFELRKPYQRTNWGKGLDIAEKKTYAPEPDHVCYDPDSFAVGDSKYYAYWPEGDAYSALDQLGQARVEERATAVVDTIEKARLSQYEMLRNVSGDVPPSTLWKNVFERDIVIATPIDVPDYFVSMVRSRVMGAGRNVKFVTVAARLDTWANSIAKLATQ